MRTSPSARMRRSAVTCSKSSLCPKQGQSRKIRPTSHPTSTPIDPRIWYENNGRTVMETLIADLNSRGHSKLTLKENGDICIQQGEELVPQEHLSNFPAKVYWPRLVEVFESNGLAAETTAQGIQVSW